MIEVRAITVKVMVDRDKEEVPEKWDWSDLTDSWCVPAGDSTLVASYSTVDEFYDSLDAGIVP